MKEERLNELKEKSTEMIQLERKNKDWEKLTNLRENWQDIIKHTSIDVMRVPLEGKQIKRQKSTFDKIMFKTSQIQLKTTYKSKKFNERQVE